MEKMSVDEAIEIREIAVKALEEFDEWELDDVPMFPALKGRLEDFVGVMTEIINNDGEWIEDEED